MVILPFLLIILVDFLKIPSIIKTSIHLFSLPGGQKWSPGTSFGHSNVDNFIVSFLEGATP